MTPPTTSSDSGLPAATSPEELRIRRWVFGDVPVIRHITFQAWLGAYGAFIPEEDMKAYLDQHFVGPALERMMASPDVHGYVAEDSSGPIGWMRTLWDPTTRRCNMTSLYVLPERQGCGAGGRLLEVAERCALSYGVSELWVGVLEQNLPALTWYEKRGFVRMHDAPFAMGKTTLSHCLCVKQLGVKGSHHGR